MREDIGLFRGKRLDNGEWVEGYLVVTPEDKEGKEFAYWIISGLDYMGGIYDVPMAAGLVDPATIGEKTGLSDREGRPIFEGDVVVVVGSDGDEEGVVATVKWAYERMGFAFDAGDWYCWSYFPPVVIGNIHDDPELLEV